MYKTLLYPYDLETAPLLRHRALQRDFELVKVVSPRGWGFTGKDACEADCGPAIGLAVESDFERALIACDTLLLVDSAITLDFDKFIYSKIECAAKKKLRIVLARRLAQSERERVAALCSLYGAECIDAGLCEKIRLQNDLAEACLQLETPVVFVAGTGERSDKFEIQLAVREELLKKGYRVSQIGTRKGCELLGFHSMPAFMFSCALSESQKITHFNHFVKEIERREKPDLFIVGIPGGVLKINHQFTNHYGVTAFEISQALEPDFVLLSSHYEAYDRAYFQRISDGLNGRYGYRVDAHVISHTKIDWQEAQNSKQLTYLSIDWDFLSAKFQKLRTAGIPVSTAFAQNTAAQLADAIIEKLSGNAYAQPM